MRPGILAQRTTTCSAHLKTVYKRFNTLSVPQQLELRKQAVEDVLSHPEWSLAQTVRHLMKTMRLTTVEMAKLSGVAYRTMQDIEQERSDGSVQTMIRIFGMLGLKLSVGRIFREPGTALYPPLAPTSPL